MPATFSAARMFPVEVWKNSSTSASSKDGELDTSTTTSAPSSASASPSPVSVLTPVLRSAATASCPCSRSVSTILEPTRPWPPMTTIFMSCLSVDGSVEGEQPVRLRDGVGEAVCADHHGGAVVAGLDPQPQGAGLPAGGAGQAPAPPRT